MPAQKQPIPSVWTRPRRQQQPPALSRERIVAEAVKLLDEEGIDNLSMRTLGTRLNAGATSLYRHVANKDELIELVVDEVYGELRVPEATGPGDWREAASGCADSLRSMILRHPWVASVFGQVGLAELGPNLMRQSDRMLALFQAAGFELSEANQAMGTLISYVVGMTTSEAALLSMLARLGQTEEELVVQVREAAMHANRELPRLQELDEQLLNDDPSKIRDRDFRYGVDRILDGLATRL
ncbi:TetR/AcrR family transcriptional regulator [Nonomuraea typhae]|uniref:TetR/AcrR family transcriptional regulator n=1 Tax=Nonomuraea typhae TaxID=2603600 RepID=UPI0012FC50AA|nr:TetR/AcrR family transcriptional regulator [Nonomuraea typhae]